MKIMIRDRNGGDWRSLENSNYSSEAHLQEFLLKEPQLIPFEPPLIACVKEFSLPGSGSTDLVAVDDAGTITLIECKLATNRDIRRTVVGQLLEYAAFLSRMSTDEFIRRFDERADRPLFETLKEELPEFNQREYEEGLAENLRVGSFNLIVAVDEINDELREIILYLNAHSDLTVAALELEYIADEKVEMLVPRLYGGAEVKEAAGRSTGRGRRKWDEQSYFEEIAELDDEVQRAIKELYDFTKQETQKVFWGSSKYGSFGFSIGKLIFSVHKDAKDNSYIWVYSHCGERLEDEVIEVFKDRIREATGRPFEKSETTFSTSILADEAKMREFKETVLWFKGQIESS